MASVGVVVGLCLVFLAGCGTYLCGMTIVRSANSLRQPSYGALIKTVYGSLSYTVLQTSIGAHVMGVMVAYIVIIRDVTTGVLEFVTQRETESPNVCTAVFILIVLVPMLLTRDLRRVGQFSRASVLMVVYFSGTLLALCIVAVVRQQSGIREVVVVPNTFGLREIQSSLTSFAVVSLSFTCHFNLVPIARSLQDDDAGRDAGPGARRRIVDSKAMEKTMIGGMGFVATTYAAVALAGYCLFGAKVRGDVLQSLTIEHAAQLLSPYDSMAVIMIGLSSISYCIALCCNYTLKLWALRSTLVEAGTGKSDADDLSECAYYTVTGVLLVTSFAVSVVVPSIFTINAAIGSTACAVFSYFFPGRLLWTQGRRGEDGRKQAAGAFLCFLSGVLAVSGTYHAFFEE